MELNWLPMELIVECAPKWSSFNSILGVDFTPQFLLSRVE
jgi:hypothetical protein